jgi:hypothetical protein
MSSKESVPRFFTFVFFAAIWTFLFFTIAYFSNNGTIPIRWPYLAVFSIGLILIGILCIAMPTGEIFADRAAAATEREKARERESKKWIEGGWTPQERAESVIDTQRHLFDANRRSHPERDPHAWLALTLEGRNNWGGREESYYHGLTSRYSVLDLAEAPVALGLFILHREDPQSAAVYGKKFEQMMLPIYELIEKGEFLSRWRTTNPWTATNHPEVAEEIEERFGKAGA